MREAFPTPSPFSGSDALWTLTALDYELFSHFLCHLKVQQEIKCPAMLTLFGDLIHVLIAILVTHA